MAGYLVEWLSQVQEEAARNRAKPSPPKPSQSLAASVMTWWNGVPSESRKEHYHMHELAELFGVAPRLLGPALHQAGWTRHRKWRGCYERVWRPPNA